MSNRSIHTLLKNWDEECPLTREEAVEVLNLPEEEMDSLMECAYALRTKYKGKKVSVQLLTNVRSGNCTQNCAYCAQSKDSQAEIEKYKRVSDEKLYGDNDLVDEKHLARHCIGLSGIGFSDEEIEDLADRIREMKKKDTQICCSIGLESFFFHQLIDCCGFTDNNVCLEFNTELFYFLDLFCNDFLFWKTELRNTIYKYSTELM